MRFSNGMVIMAGLVAGALTVLLLPSRVLFVPAASTVEADATSRAARWACPMMDFIGSAPGLCPVCGMTMHPVTAGALTREAQRRMGLETTRVNEGPAVVTVRAYGAADYDHRYTRLVLARVAGRIVHRYEATYGCCTVVEAGVPIVDLYSEEVLAAQGELRAALAMGEPQLVAALRQRFMRWNLADVADKLEAGGDILETITIRSPYAGQVLLRDFEMANEALEVGREVQADTPLLRLVDPDKLVLIVHVPEVRARFLREGQSVALSSDDRGDLPGVKAVVDRVAQEIDPTIRTREVRIYLEGARGELVPGALVSARMAGALGPDLTPADPAEPTTLGKFPLVPKSAVLSTGVRHVAWRVAERLPGGTLRFEPVTLALGPRLEDDAGHDQVVVRAGLRVGDEVATQGAFLIDSQAQLAGSPSLLFPLGAVREGAAGGGGATPEHAH